MLIFGCNIDVQIIKGVTVMLTIVVDEGSTYTKVAYVDSKSRKLKTVLMPNSFRSGWKTGFADVVPSNYQIGATKYCYDKTADIAIETTSISYQYSDQSLLAVHHSLLETKLEPQEINLVVTLPVTQYYNSNDNQINQINVDRKIQNLKRSLSRMNNAPTFNFSSIKVMPESLPAAISELSSTVTNDFERTLCIDAGGTTLDYGVIVGAYDDISNIGGNENIGVVSVSKRVQTVMDVASSRISQSMANEFIVKRNDNDFVKSVINDHSKIDMVLSETDLAIQSYVDSVIAEIKKFGNTINRILIVGGGAHLLLEPIKLAFPIIAQKIKIIENPQLALACEIMKYESDDITAYDVPVEVVDGCEN